ncbi:MAG: rhodanese-like domain-containing protein [Candidatus Nanoarchaeia archaeon]
MRVTQKEQKKRAFFSPTLLSIMSGALIIGSVITGLIYNSSSNTTSNTMSENNLNMIETVNVENFKEKVDSDEYIIIDIRTPEEFNQGHIEGAINIDFYESSFEEQVKNLDKDKKYIFYCRSGSRSSSALQLFNNLNFQEVYELRGGILSWIQEGFELN